MSIMPEVKPSDALSAGEIDEMHAIYRSIDPNMPENHIVVNHIETTQPVFHLFKVNGRIKAYKSMANRWENGMEKHGIAIRAVATTVQYKMDTVESLLHPVSLMYPSRGDLLFPMEKSPRALD